MKNPTETKSNELLDPKFMLPAIITLAFLVITILDNRLGWGMFKCHALVLYLILGFAVGGLATFYSGYN